METKKQQEWVPVLQRYGQNRRIYIRAEDAKAAEENDEEEQKEKQLKLACVVFVPRSIDSQDFRRHMECWKTLGDDDPHPSLVLPFTFVDRPHQQHAIMPYLSTPLSYIVYDCDRPRALNLIYELCDVLNYLHVKGQCHGDLALDHVFVEKTGRKGKYGDDDDEGEEHIRLPWYPHLKRDVYEKTRKWVAPEVNHVVRPESDVFQFAYICFCLLEKTIADVRSLQFSKPQDERDYHLMSMICRMADPDVRARPSIRDVQDLIAALRAPHVAPTVLATLTKSVV